jgi:hypothetical protein
VVIEWARRHYRRSSRPYLFEARTGDWRFDVLPGSHGRYLLALDPERGQELGLLEGAEGSPEDHVAQVLIVLADAVVCALGGEPLDFECEGFRVGRVEIVSAPGGGHAVRVRGHVSLTCLSWLLHEGRSGYYLALPAVLGEVASSQADNYNEEATP